MVKRYFKLLASLSLPHPAQQIILQEYIGTVKMCSDRVARLTEQIRQLFSQSRLSLLSQPLQSLPGV